MTALLEGSSAGNLSAFLLDGLQITGGEDQDQRGEDQCIGHIDSSFRWRGRAAVAAGCFHIGKEQAQIRTACFMIQ
jgi:hypothetical protein